jgi:hypothetical protein
MCVVEKPSPSDIFNHTLTVNIRHSTPLCPSKIRRQGWAMGIGERERKASKRKRNDVEGSGATEIGRLIRVHSALSERGVRAGFKALSKRASSTSRRLNADSTSPERRSWIHTAVAGRVVCPRLSR